jgi:hypothetical protein
MASPLTREFRAEWPSIRKLGFRKFAIEYGLRRFALPTGLMVWTITWVVVPVLFVPASPPDLSYLGTRRFWLGTISSLVLFPIAGWLFAKTEWMRYERRFWAQSRAARTIQTVASYSSYTRTSPPPPPWAAPGTC